MSKLKYVVQADYENGETLFVPPMLDGETPVLSVDEARLFLTEKKAQAIADEWNAKGGDLMWEVAEA